MITHELIQGSEAWHQHRATHFNASDAPAMMGCSPYMTRTQLLRRLHTGITPEVDAGTQARFNDGHRFEALARPLAEAIIGEELYPVVGSDGELSASFDGLTMEESIAFEHKSLNHELLAAMPVNEGRVTFCPPDFPLLYAVQMEQQLMVSGAERCLFMASKWEGEKLVEERHFWYMPDPALRQQIIDGWKQFAIDLAAYVPVESVVAPAVAAPTLGLPAVSIQVNGSIALIDNLDVFGTALKAYIGNLNQKPQTDQDFADLDGAVKTLQKAEDALKAAEDGALAQTAGIDAMRKTVALYRELARTNRLMVDKIVKAEKDNRKIAIVQAGRKALQTHESSLQERTQHYLPPTQHNFENAAKGLKTIASIQNAVDTELARCKIEANAVADKIEANLNALTGTGYDELFSDERTLVLKAPDDLANIITVRITTHQAKEAARIEADRARIRAEEQAKAEQGAREKLAMEQAEAARTVTVPDFYQLATPKPAQIIPKIIPVLSEKADADRSAVAFIDRISPPTLKLGMIADRLGFTVTAEFLRTLGFEPAATDRASKLYHEYDFPNICNALVQHINSVCETA